MMVCAEARWRAKARRQPPQRPPSLAPVQVVASAAVGASSPVDFPLFPYHDGTYATDIPAAVLDAANPGSLLRWRVRADAGGTSNTTAWRGAALDANATEFGGLPVLDWWSPNPDAAASAGGANGTEWLLWHGIPFRASIKRKGTTSLSWPKAKLAVKLEDGVRLPLFAGAGDADTGTPSDHAVRAFDLNSLWWEPGENSYVREYASFAAARAAGVVAPACRHVVVRLNGAFHGLYTLNERQDEAWLKRVGLADRGTLWKPKDGAWANLRPDAPGYAYPIVWDAVAGPADVNSVARLATDLAGRGAGRGARAAALAGDGGSLAATINYLAVMAALLTQDRCTKNYYLLLDKGGASWRLLPGDSKSAMGADSGLGGAPAKDYAIEHGDQWASPLYCDANHPQDVEASAREPWSKLVAAPLSGRRRALAEAPPVAGHRRALFQAPATPKRFSTYTNASAGCDAAFTGAPGGAQGTFNWGVDAILRCPPLRSAYLRRLATVVTLLHGDGGGGNSTGVLREIVEAATARVAAAAAVDNDAWRGGDPARGAAQLLDEQMPRRARALRERYGLEGGSLARMVPPPQAADGAVGAVWDPASNCVILSSPSGDAVDVSGWRVAGPATAALPPGTVVPPGGAVAVGRDPGKAKAPQGGPVLGFEVEDVGGVGGGPAVVSRPA